MGSCFLWESKVGGWLNLVGHEFWVWASLGGVTVSLKFRQFISAVCDAFGGDLVLVGFARVYVVFVGCWGLELLAFSLELLD